MTKRLKTVRREVSMTNALLKLVVIQFAVYTFFGVLGFVAWALTFSNNTAVTEIIVGEYLQGHLMRWTTHFPLWGILLLISAILSFCAAWLLQNSRRIGGYLGTISFSIGFVTNIICAQNILVHSLIGFIIGWTLLAPLVVAWKDLE